MNRTIRPCDDFFLHPPWGAGSLTFLFLLIGACVLLRCSELGGAENVRACRAALLVMGIAGAISVIPVLKCWGRSGFRMLIGVSIGTAIRLLISLVGAAILMRFTSISPFRLVVFWGLSYGLFLLAETGITIWLLRTVIWEDQEVNNERVPEYVWYADRVH